MRRPILNSRVFLVYGIVAFALAWWLAPDGNSTGESGILRTALGPLRTPVAALLRIRAAFARNEARFDESLQLQGVALDLDPQSTESVLIFSDEVAYDAPGATTDRDIIKNAARDGIRVLHEAQRLGNTHVRLLDAEARLLTERVAPAGLASREERNSAIDRAIQLCEAVAQKSPFGCLRGSPLLHERAIEYYKTKDIKNAILHFERAAHFEEVLESEQVPGASALANLNRRCARICALETDPARRAERAALIQELRAEFPKSPFPPLAEAR